MRRSLRNWDTQGWQIQMAATSYPIGKKKRRIGYRLSKFIRLYDEFDNKYSKFDKLVENIQKRFKLYPKGRLVHLRKQLNRLEFYIGQMGGGDG